MFHCRLVSPTATRLRKFIQMRIRKKKKKKRETGMNCLAFCRVKFGLCYNSVILNFVKRNRIRVK